MHRATTTRLISWVMCGIGFWMLTGCFSAKPTLERGWVGGELESIGNQALLTHAENSSEETLSWIEKGEKSVLIRNLHSQTPLYAAGLREGDVILAVDGKSFDEPTKLATLVDEAQPGSSLTFQAFRFGELIATDVTVGSELYRDWGQLSFGLSFSGSLDLWPNPDFNLLGLIRYHSNERRVQLQDPRVRLLSPPESGERGVQSSESSGFWFFLFGLGRRVEVLSQELRDGSATVARAEG